MFLYKKLENNQIQCLACNHYCKISNNQAWICWVRKNDNWKLNLLIYGKALWINVDPIEKKPLYHFLPWTKVFSFWTAWCNFRCQFCQNRHMSQAKSFPEIINQWKKLQSQEIVDHCLENNIPSIAYTYNEPTVFFEYAYDTMKLAKKKWIKNVWVSNGYMSCELLKKIKNLIDAINIDLKSFDENFYNKICWAKLKPVLDNIKWFKKNKIRVEITTMIIPWLNDSEYNIEKIAKFIYKVSPSIPRHISAFYPNYKMQNIQSTWLEILSKAYEIWKKVWLEYIYIGNVVNNWHENTHCSACGLKLTSRNWYNVEINSEKWICPSCKNKIAWIRK